jgi:hypothetical protein
MPRIPKFLRKAGPKSSRQAPRRKETAPRAEAEPRPFVTPRKAPDEPHADAAPPRLDASGGDVASTAPGPGPPIPTERADHPAGPDRPTRWRSWALGGLLLLTGAGAGAGGGALLDEGAMTPPANSPYHVNRYMTRLATEWATFERLKGQAGRAGQKHYGCGQQRRRLERLQAELIAIGPPDKRLHQEALAYLEGLRKVTNDCLGSQLTGEKVATRYANAQDRWAIVRIRALTLGWDTPCALENRIAACGAGR